MLQNNLIVKDVKFQGYSLKSAQNTETNIIYVAVKWVCQGIGLNRGQINNETIKVNTDLVLSKGARNLVLPTSGGKQEVLCIDIEFLPLWLAKISITPNMQKKQSDVVDKLIEYQLKAKDVLAKAFLYGEFDLPKTYTEALKQLFKKSEENDKLQSENTILAPKAEIYDMIMDANGTFSMNQVAKNVGMGEYKLFQFLRDSKVLFYEGNDCVPYQRFRSNGCFKVVTTVDYRGFIHSTTRVYPKGLTYVCKLIAKSERTVA